jgi:hypothetical protein
MPQALLLSEKVQESYRDILDTTDLPDSSDEYVQNPYSAVQTTRELVENRQVDTYQYNSF